MNAFLSATVYVSHQTRRALETLATLNDPEGSAAGADAIAESVLRAHCEGIPAIVDLQKRISKAVKEAKAEWEKEQKP